MLTYSQDRICFVDSLDFCKDEIEKLERYNLRMLRKNPAYWKYSNLKQLHFFFLKNKTNCPITKEEYLDYSFLKKLKFSRSRTWFWGKLLNADTFLFTPEGKLVGKICFGFVEPLGWLKIFNADELGRLVAENKISFAFCGGHRDLLYTSDAFRYGAGDMNCVVIDGKIFLLDNLYFNAESPDGRKLHLLSLEEFIDKHK
jgi:hypothetical protein